MNATASHRVFQGPLPASSRRRLVRLLGLLARPDLGDRGRAELATLTSHPKWEPVTRLPSISLLEPLFCHHAIRAGIPWEALFVGSDGEAVPRPDFRQVATEHYLQRGALRNLLALLLDAGVGQLVLVKGCALGPFYPSPALRRMCDADIVVAESDLRGALRALRSSEWQPASASSPGVWVHPCGFGLDLHVPHTAFARQAFARAIPHARFDDPRVQILHPADHLILLALHTARHGGNRLWRDVCDAQVLLQQPGAESAEISDRVAATAAEGSGGAAGAFFSFFNEVAAPPTPLPVPAGIPSEYLSLYRRMAVETASPVALDLLRSLRQPAGHYARRLWKRVRELIGGAREAGGREPLHTDPSLGEEPPEGGLSRDLYRLRLARSLAGSPARAHYERLVRLQNRVLEVAKPFELPPYPGEGG